MKPFIKRKLVKVRKTHECSTCTSKIENGTFALHESGYDKEIGWVSTYIHVNPKNNYSCLVDYFDILKSCEIVKEIIKQISNIEIELFPKRIRNCVPNYSEKTIEVEA